MKASVSALSTVTHSAFVVVAIVLELAGMPTGVPIGCGPVGRAVRGTDCLRQNIAHHGAER